MEREGMVGFALEDGVGCDAVCSCGRGEMTREMLERVLVLYEIVLFTVSAARWLPLGAEDGASLQGCGSRNPGRVLLCIQVSLKNHSSRYVHM